MSMCQLLNEPIWNVAAQQTKLHAIILEMNFQLASKTIWGDRNGVSNWNFRHLIEFFIK